MRKLIVLPQSRRELLQVSQLRAATTNPSTLTLQMKKRPNNEKSSSSFAFPSLKGHKQNQRMNRAM